MRVVFMGSPPFAGPVFDALLASPSHSVVGLVTRPDKPRGRGMRIVESELVARARTREVALLQPERARGPEFIAALRALKPDVIIVASFGEILKADVLELPAFGCLNVHASLLPRHRGASPIQAAIQAGDIETGVSVQRMVLALDEGDVVIELRTQIGEHENGGELLERLALLGGEAAVRALDQLAAGTAHFTPQDHTRATYAKKIKKEDGVIDWSHSAVDLDRRVRAFTPWPGARATTSSGEIVLLDVRVHGDTPDRAAPGTILATRPTLLVACGAGALELHALKPAGKGRMDAQAWLNGARLDVGANIGGA
ncbi:MAG: methionyl-tRNA formyltransferase [Planctomycetes bacterium]|nr:methionyl-tRNA formyltransferase [Planctomycetota bacterium]